MTPSRAHTLPSYLNRCDDHATFNMKYLIVHIIYQSVRPLFMIMHDHVDVCAFRYFFVVFVVVDTTLHIFYFHSMFFFRSLFGLCACANTAIVLSECIYKILKKKYFYEIFIIIYGMCENAMLLTLALLNTPHNSSNKKPNVMNDL